MGRRGLAVAWTSLALTGAAAMGACTSDDLAPPGANDGDASLPSQDAAPVIDTDGGVDAAVHDAGAHHDASDATTPGEGGEDGPIVDGGVDAGKDAGVDA